MKTAAFLAAAFVVGYVAACAARLPHSEDNDDAIYWRGFADGEYHAQLEQRTPSLN